MRHLLLIAALLSLATAAFTADKPAEKSGKPAAKTGKPAEKKAPWLVRATTNPAISTDGRSMRIELKITNNTDAKQTLEVLRFWECHCDSNRLRFGGWDIELRPANPSAPATTFTPPNSKTTIALGPGESYRRSWNWVIASEEAKAAGFAFRLGLVINGDIGKEPVWSAPITLKIAKPHDAAAGKK